MNNTDKEYFRLLNLVKDSGRRKSNRTTIDTIGTFGAQARFNLSEDFPLLTTKKVFMKGIVHELLWFLSGSTNIKYLVDNDVHIWDGNCYDRYSKVPLRNLNNTETVALEGGQRRYGTKEEFIKEIRNNDRFAFKWGELGYGTYGSMWRGFEYSEGPDELYGKIDQITEVINKLKTNPDDRRLIISAWHPYWVDHCVLPPCHCLFQFYTEELTECDRLHLWQKKFCSMIDSNGETVVTCGLPNFQGVGFMERFDKDGIPKRRLSCQLYQRSCDLFLGVPFNIASYALLTAMMAQVSNMVPGDFVHTYGDLHLYENHLPQVEEQLAREPRKLPKLELNPEIKNIFDFKYEDIKITGYDPHPAIKGEMAV